MGLSNMSLGEMLGFPSAKFQPPENLFAHRSTKEPAANAHDAWSFRSPSVNTAAMGDDRSFGRGRSSIPSRFDTDVDMNDAVDDDDRSLDARLRRTGLGYTMDHSAEGTQRSAFGHSFAKDRIPDTWSEGREAFAAQRYFPPEPETGLEDNFFGVVKIVDDYLPQRQEPRTIVGRDLMLKKRMARRWLIVAVDRWTTMFRWIGQLVFAAGILHASAFWVVGEYHILQHYLDKDSKGKASASKAHDPFQPTYGDRACSPMAMNFLASGLNTLRGQKGQPQTGSETVDRLCERIQHGTLLEDRRAAVQALRSCSREHKRDIGTRGVLVLCKVLQQDAMDIDICKAVLETLTVLCQAEADREESHEFAMEMSMTVLEASFTLAACQCPRKWTDANNVAVLLDMLEEYDFYVRFHVVSLLSTLVLNNTTRLQECILTSPMGMSRLMALLDDRREIIRNEGLLLLISLTESNADLQKIVAFENAFERLLAIIADEGAISGGIIVQDCLQLVQNLLRYNVSNQNYFRETSCIQRIPALFSEEMIDENGQQDLTMKDVWSDQKGNNMIMVLELIRVLVVPDHSNTAPNQKSMFQSGILQLLVDLALTSNAPQRVKASALYALAELIRLNKVNQDALSKAVIIPAHPPPAPSNDGSSALTPPGRSSAQLSRTSFQSGRGSAQGDHRSLEPRERCPAIVEVVAIAVGNYPGCTYSVRAAATCLFQSFVLENPDTQMVLATTLNPPPEDNPNTTSSEKPRSPGTLLLGALQGWQDGNESASTDPYNSWFATVLFAHILQNNPRAKSIALAITFGDEENGEDPVSLIHAIAAALMVAVKEQSDVRVALGYLALLCVWCYDSPKSIKDLLSEGAHLQFLIELINPSSKEDPMVQGLAAFLLGICYEFNWEPDALISRATIQPIILSRIGLDHFAACITRVRESKPFKAAAPLMVVLPSEEGGGRLPGLYFDYSFVEFMKKTFERTQKSISISPDQARPHQGSMQGHQDASESQFASFQSKITSQNTEINELRSLLEESRRIVAEQTQERERYEETIAGLREEMRMRQDQYGVLEQEHETLRQVHEALGREHESLGKEHEDLLICLAEQDQELTGLKEHMRSLGIAPLE
ncbi:hypothetical protein EC968_005203 [Mortierella alpina]|nr:hypothetical protein EC968_005203 [Mortierella alpina]